MRTLPSPNAPMIADDGTLIAPTAATSFARIEIPSNSQAQRLVTNTRRKLIDLPAVPKQMNSFAIILVYTASGLSDAEIGVATGLTTAQIANIRTNTAYTQLEEYVIQAAQEQSKSDVQAILAQAEIKSANRISSLTNSLDEKIALAASKDVLDRRGHVPKQQIDVNAEMRKTFRIEFVDRRGEQPVIDMELTDGDNS
jgi:hypothetical protein